MILYSSSKNRNQLDVVVMNLIQQFFNMPNPDKFQDIKIDENFPFVCCLYWKDRNSQYRANDITHSSFAGYHKREDVYGCTDYDLIWSNSAPQYTANDKKVIYKGTPTLFFEHGVIQDKENAYFLSAKAPLRLRSNKVDGIVGLSILFAPEQSDELFSTLLIDSYTAGGEQDYPALSPKQQDCLFFLVLGMTQKETASQMKLSPKTVEHYLETVKIKLNCKSRSELIKKALQLPYIRHRLKNI